ncbi:hypothetical protein GGF32_007441 [Allomyces javanicus]|nr:hypothetical protein GGF32_007441 [Allomyces javanicus]
MDAFQSDEAAPPRPRRILAITLDSCLIMIQKELRLPHVQALVADSPVLLPQRLRGADNTQDHYLACPRGAGD